MRRNARTCCWLFVALLTLGAGPQKPEAEPKDGLDIYFREASLLSVADQELPQYPDTSPGESKRASRDFPDAPPSISHTVEDMLPIALDDNECLECHHPENAIEKTDVPLPDSHFRAAVMGNGGPNDPMVWVVKGYKKTEDLAGARYNCTMCHTPQATNVKQPKNHFTPARQVQPAKDSK
jgi:cytochrome c-type protein NapB